MKKIILLLAICLATQFVFTSKASSYGKNVSLLQEEINSLKNENQKLEIKIASLGSLTSLFEKNSETTLFSSNVSDSSMALKR